MSGKATFTILASSMLKNGPARRLACAASGNAPRSAGWRSMDAVATLTMFAPSSPLLRKHFSPGPARSVSSGTGPPMPQTADRRAGWRAAPRQRVPDGRAAQRHVERGIRQVVVDGGASAEGALDVRLD